LCKAMGRSELADDPRFLDQALRLEHVEELDEIVTAWTSAHTCAELERVLTEVGVPNGKAASVAEAVESEQVRHRDMLLDVEHPGMGQLKLMGIPIKLSGTPGSVRKPPPTIGEANDEIYTGLLGMTAAEVTE